MIHVVGNAAIDTIFRVERFPVAGETIVAIAAADDLGGKGANQAVVAARAGARVGLVAAVGDDNGARIRARLAAEGVAIDRLHVWGGPTDRSSIYVDAAGENTIVSAIGAANAFDPLAAGALDAVQAGDTVLCQGNLRLEVLTACLTAIRSQAVTTVVNPSPARRFGDFDWGLADVVVLNAVEAAEISGGNDPRSAANRLRAGGAGVVVVTLGSEGAVMLADQGLAEFAAPKVHAVDTTGAGDVFCGMLTALRARGLSWQESLLAAAEAAALSVTRRGVMASFPSVEEIRAMVPRLRSGGESG